MTQTKGLPNVRRLNKPDLALIENRLGLLLFLFALAFELEHLVIITLTLILNL